MDNRKAKSGLWSEIIASDSELQAIAKEEEKRRDRIQNQVQPIYHRRRQTPTHSSGSTAEAVQPPPIPRNRLTLAAALKRDSWNRSLSTRGRTSIAVGPCVKNQPQEKQAKRRGKPPLPKGHVAEPPSFDKEREYFQEVDAFELLEESPSPKNSWVVGNRSITEPIPHVSSRLEKWLSKKLNLCCEPSSTLSKILETPSTLMDPTYISDWDSTPATSKDPTYISDQDSTSATLKDPIYISDDQDSGLTTPEKCNKISTSSADEGFKDVKDIDAAIRKLSLASTATSVDIDCVDSFASLLEICKQSTPLKLLDLFSKYCDPENIVKIGEGTYGEAFKAGKTVCKIVPFDGDFPVNGEVQKKSEELLEEAVLSQTLNTLRKFENDVSNACMTFIETIDLKVCQGPYDAALIRAWEKWDEKNSSENDHPKEFPEKQRYVVFVLQHGGKDLESFVLENFDEARSLLVQVTAALAVAEAAYEFEHRALVGFSYDARGESAASSISRAISFLQLNKVRVFTADDRVLTSLSNSGVSVDLLLNESFVENLTSSSSNSSAISWLKTHLLAHLNIKTIVVSSSDTDTDNNTHLAKLLSTLKSIDSLLTSFKLHRQVKVSVAFSSSFLPKLNSPTYQSDLLRIFGFINKIGSSVIVDAEPSMGDQFLHSAIEAPTVPILMTIKSPAFPRATEFIAKVGKSLETNNEVSAMEDFVEEKEEQSTGGRQLLSTSVKLKTTEHDIIFPPTTTIPNNPNPTPTIVTVPSTNPVTITPANPADTPAAIPTTTPVTVPSTNPNNPTVPITNPVTTPAPVAVPGAAQPVTNPVTTYPAPTGGVPVSTPVTNPVTVPPPVTTNAPAIPGQSWCVAKSGAPESSLQAALDYACGIGGADCSQIQQGASCYNPNSLQNHASFAFNSYYQKNPAPTSCDFGGTATIVNTNPSSGSCIYPNSASQSTPTATPTAIPTVTPPTTSSTSGAGVPGSVTPPSVLNSSTPGSGSGATTVFGSDAPPSSNTSTSMSGSAAMKPLISSFIAMISFVAAVIFLGV
ncbi:Glycoside hydrolase, family 17 [Corchorus capsularis]|uniref:Glycoside hydrolase, family 17 n=1 Tax=Corchorus capsularis TaxID=210143 RepID=A0A1R3IUQ0_COCAP|nr:Glycoside hydrolase, family 17 [Corchorus capsularis]